MYLEFNENNSDSNSEVAPTKICWGCEQICFLACTSCSGCQGSCSGVGTKG